jgi:hypothetical protein
MAVPSPGGEGWDEGERQNNLFILPDVRWVSKSPSQERALGSLHLNPTRASERNNAMHNWPFIS